MDPQFAFLAGENILRARMRERQSRMATAANTGDTKNIMMVVPSRPTRLVCHEKYLNEGLETYTEVYHLYLFNSFATRCQYNYTLFQHEIAALSIQIHDLR